MFIIKFAIIIAYIILYIIMMIYKLKYNKTLKLVKHRDLIEINLYNSEY